jgi:hypothetical protein
MKKLLSKKLYFAFAVALASTAYANDQHDSAMSRDKNSNTTLPSDTNSTMHPEYGDARVGGKPSASAKMDAEYKGKTDIPKTEVSHAEISFAENSAQLSDSDKANLRNMIRDASEKGDISKVTVAVWSDKPLPQQNQKLLDSDRELASSRAEAISSFLQDEMKVDVQTYNMAENSHWLARTFGTDEAELKSVFGRKGSEEAPVSNEQFRVIRDAGGPSKAVIVAEHKISKSDASKVGSKAKKSRY